MKTKKSVKKRFWITRKITSSETRTSLSTHNQSILARSGAAGKGRIIIKNCDKKRLLKWVIHS